LPYIRFKALQCPRQIRDNFDLFAVDGGCLNGGLPMFRDVSSSAEAGHRLHGWIEI
jgi:hypothetical protein